MIEITLPVHIGLGDVDVTIALSNRDYAALKHAYKIAEEEETDLWDISDLEDEELAERIHKKVMSVLNTEPDYTEELEGFQDGDDLEDMFSITIVLPDSLELVE